MIEVFGDNFKSKVAMEEVDPVKICFHKFLIWAYVKLSSAGVAILVGR